MYGTYSWAQSQQHMKQALSSSTSSTEGQCHGCAFDRLAGVYDNIVDWEETSMLYGLMRSRLLSKARVSRVTSSCFWAPACLSMLRGVVLVQLSPVTTITIFMPSHSIMHHMHQCSDCKIHALLNQSLVTRPTDKQGDVPELSPGTGRNQPHLPYTTHCTHTYHHAHTHFHRQSFTLSTFLTFVCLFCRETF